VMASKSTASMIGPLVGGAAYDAGGLALPFFIGGSLILLSATMQCTWLLSMYDGEAKDKIAVDLRTVCSPQYAVLVLVTFVFLSAWFMTEPLVAVWWTDTPYDLTATGIGLVSIIASLYGNGVLLVGTMMSPKVGLVLIVTLASLLGLLSSWVYAPAPFLPFIPKELWQLLVGVGGMTTAQNLALPAIQPLLVSVCEKRNLPSQHVASVVSSTNLMVFGAAGTLAPLLSGGLYASHSVSIPWLITGWCLSFGILALVVPLALWDLQPKARRDAKPSSDAVTEGRSFMDA